MAIVPGQQQGRVRQGGSGRLEQASGSGPGRHEADHSAEAARRRGSQALAAVLPRLTRPAFRRRSPAAVALMADWPAVVGPALAAVTQPERLTAGTLTIACAGPVAMELTHFAPQLLARINGQAGAAVAQRLRFVQRPLRAAPPPAPPSLPPPSALPPATRQALEAVAEPGLRDALAKLGQAVYRSRD